MNHPWLADRTRHFDSSGIRKVFDLASKLKDPINLSIGQPHFDMPAAAKRAAIEAIEQGKNAYTQTQGVAPLREKLSARIAKECPGDERGLLVTSGTSGGLVLAILSLVNPGDEAIVFDPCFVMYPALISLAGGTCVRVDTYPDFRLDPDRLEAAITPKTKVILFNSPGNPTGGTATAAEVRALAALAERRGIALVSDEIYRDFCYDEPFVSPARFNAATIVIDGFSKSYAMTGWRLGFAHGPAAIIDAMTRLQQYTFVCAPQPAQWAGIAALDVDMTPFMADYRKKRDRLLAALGGAFEIARPGGAFYAFPRTPWGTGSQFVSKAIERELLIIPGGIFSERDTHFRISYAATDRTIERGIDVLLELASKAP